MPPELHALVAGFADVAAVYDRGRPDYPPAMVQRVIAELGVASGARVLEVGAGTGKLTRPLVAAGLDVVAVEPMKRMRAALAAAVGAERVLDGRAEALPFGDASLDGAVCAEAFHWFDGERAAAELHRVLRPAAGLVLSWLEYQTGESPWADEVVALLRPLWERGRHPGIAIGRRGEAVAEHPGFAPVRRVELLFDDEVDRDGLVAWFASFSVVGALPDDERSDLLARIAAILDGHRIERATRSWRADLWVTRRTR